MCNEKEGRGRGVMIPDRSWRPYQSQENTKEEGPAGRSPTLVLEATGMQYCRQPLGAKCTSGSPLCTEVSKASTETMRSPSSVLWLRQPPRSQSDLSSSPLHCKWLTEWGFAMTHQSHSLRVLVVHLARHTPPELSDTRGTGALTDHRRQPSLVPDRGAP